MFKKITYAVLFVVTQNICLATMFSPLPFDQQVEEATSAVEVKLGDSKVFKNASGMIMTEYAFDVLESYNLSADDLDNHQLKLTMPGGTYNGVTSMIDGAPQFNKDEKSFLLLKKIASKIYLSNFTLGKFKIQNDNGNIFYVSDVFPMDPKIGRISKEKMLELIKEKWHISQVTPINMPAQSNTIITAVETKSIIKSIHDLERAPAQEELAKEEGSPLFFWNAIIIFTFFFVFIFFKLGKYEGPNKNE